MAQGVSIQQRSPPLYLLTNVMVVVAAHTPCRGGGGGVDEVSSAQPNVCFFLYTGGALGWGGSKTWLAYSRHSALI